MSSSFVVSLLFIVSLIAANIPFVSDKKLLLLSSDNDKKFWLRALEWFLVYLVVMAIAIGLELKLHGNAYSNVW